MHITGCNKINFWVYLNDLRLVLLSTKLFYHMFCHSCTTCIICTTCMFCTTCTTFTTCTTGTTCKFCDKCSTYQPAPPPLTTPPLATALCMIGPHPAVHTGSTAAATVLKIGFKSYCLRPKYILNIVYSLKVTIFVTYVLGSHLVRWEGKYVDIISLGGGQADWERWDGGTYLLCIFKVPYNMLVLYKT